MKKLIIATIMLATIATSAFADGPGVNYRAVTHLNKVFKNAQNVQWKQVGDLFKASFILNGELVESFYTEDGDFVGVGRNITLDKLPLQAKQAVQEKYSSYTVKEVIEYTSAEEGLSYYVRVEKNGKDTILQTSAQGAVSIFRKY